MAAKQSPTVVRYCKELIMEAPNGDMSKAFIKEQKLFVTLWETEDQQEGVSTFLEKRSLDWKN